MKKIVFGLLVITAGVLLILFNLEALPLTLKPIIFSWQMLLIALGLVNLVDRNSWLLGFILISVGGFFLAPTLIYFPFQFTHIFWPLLLILLGIMIIVKRFRVQTWKHKMHHKFNSVENITKEGFIEDSNVFSGGKRRIVSSAFKGGKFNNIFGGAEIDLSQCIMADDTATIEVNCIFGRVSLIVPQDWEVELQASNVMGGFVDKRMATNPATGFRKKLIIKGSAIFGGGEIKSF